MRKKIKDILGIKAEDAQAAAAILRALNHALRHQLLQLLQEHSSLCVTDIYKTMRLEQSIVSQHLSILRRAGIVEGIRQGKNIYYQVNQERVKALKDFISELQNLKFEIAVTHGDSE